MNPHSKNHIILELEKDLHSRFAPVFSKGVDVKACLNVSIREFVCGQLGIEERYLENRIQTIFLDGKPVDDYNTAIIRDGSMLALSAAMPGLVGAIMRRGGHFAAMRKEITHVGENSTTCDPEGSVTIKLFNLTVREIGPVLLKYGIHLSSGDLQHVLTLFADGFKRGCKKVTLNKSTVTLDELSAMVEESDSVYLQIKEI
jgi:hypothetical protein